MLAELGRVVSYATLGVMAAGAIVSRPREGGRVVRAQIARQIVFSAWDGIPLVALIAGMMTVSIVVIVATLAPAASTPELVGGLLATVIVRELAPLMTAVIVALRSCAAVTVELGYMSWRGEVEALETMAIDPAKFLLLPRFAGLTIASVSLTIVFTATVFGAAAAGVRLLEVDSSVEHMATVLHTLVSATAMSVAVIKATAFGLIIAAVSCYHGLSVRSDVTHLPRRATRALVEVLVLCTSVNVAITLIAL